MRKIDAINEANELKNKFGGQYHVVVIDGELYTVHNSWFQFHDHHSEIVFSQEAEEYSRKLSVVRRIIVKFNTFLLWLFNKLINVRKNNKGSS